MYLFRRLSRLPSHPYEPRAQTIRRRDLIVEEVEAYRLCGGQQYFRQNLIMRHTLVQLVEPRATQLLCNYRICIIL